MVGAVFAQSALHFLPRLIAVWLKSCAGARKCTGRTIIFRGCYQFATVIRRPSSGAHIPANRYSFMTVTARLAMRGTDLHFGSNIDHGFIPEFWAYDTDL